MKNQSRFITFAGFAGCLGAILVGIGEFSMQFTPNGGIEDIKDYLYFNDISLDAPDIWAFHHCSFSAFIASWLLVFI